MYVRLNFTADKQLNTVFRVVNEIINNTAITSIATLNSTATAGTWNAGLLSGLDTTNSEIVRTGSGNTALTTTNTKSKYIKLASESNTDSHEWTVEFSCYDALSTKYYVQHYGTGASTNSSYCRVGTSITGSMTTGATAPTVADTSVSAGTTVGLNTTGTTLPSTSTIATTTNGFTTVRTFVMYITDKCMIWATTNGNTYNNGFGGTYNSTAAYTGPWIFSQYTRFDYHNTNANGIIPLMFTNITAGNGLGFGGTTNYWNNPENTQATAQTTQSFRVMNCVNAYPTTGSSFPIVVAPTVNWGIGSRYSDTAAMNTSAAGTAATITANTYGAAIFNTVSTRYPSADLKSQSYGMLPLTWRHLYYYNAGGDASAQGNFYIFNGDYFPGDEYTYGGKTYKIIPTYIGYSQRVGIAIPKE